MSITKRDLIKNKYAKFYDFLKENNFEKELSLFPNLDEIDVADLTYFLTLTFIGISEKEDFRNKILVISELNGAKLSDEQLNIIIPPFQEFMIWMRSI